ncbi:hypothetical protein GQ43DRAFT_427590 [Delitschia confertaspora ATCC 74209]|uniref:Copper acquisition factor BIM1-like domain-containing protein n=1 Tax=Delitschia confertaspora ATCC 74209 TaxID=1513339 RepID=A0A9P4JVN5_9PLEO|nr:hypothetical protein GQ43DRAFT_427590 [Delitschia confertaspora ATCC 74209]
MLASQSLVVFAATWALTAAHTVIVYPGWRGNNIHTNGTVAEDDPSIIPGSLGITHYENGTVGFPYGMQWMYPCGGMPTSQNRTKWPVAGGAISIQPGWFPGHSLAWFYINLGFGNEPQNMSHSMVPVFQITGPSNQQYPGTFCLPQVPLPADYHPKIGDNATIQVIEAAQHGAALYNCVDITFADPKDVAEVNSSNCFNSTGTEDNIGFNLVFASKSLNSAAYRSVVMNNHMSILSPMLFATVAWFLL